jgi:hypothetical protein
MNRRESMASCSIAVLCDGVEIWSVVLGAGGGVAGTNVEVEEVWDELLMLLGFCASEGAT